MSLSAHRCFYTHRYPYLRYPVLKGSRTGSGGHSGGVLVPRTSGNGGGVPVPRTTGNGGGDSSGGVPRRGYYWETQQEWWWWWSYRAVVVYLGLVIGGFQPFCVLHCL